MQTPDLNKNQNFEIIVLKVQGGKNATKTRVPCFDFNHESVWAEYQKMHSDD